MYYNFKCIQILILIQIYSCLFFYSNIVGGDIYKFPVFCTLFRSPEGLPL